MKELRPALVALLAFTVLTGIVYPALVTGIGKVLFPHQAEGSLLVDHGQVVGSELIGQEFTHPAYFWGRPSAIGPFAYDAMTSAGTNQSQGNPTLREDVVKRLEALRAADPDNRADVPIDLVTASASGLDPHITPAAAYYQAGRVARARGLPLEDVRRLVADHVEDRVFGILGEPRVNVLALDRALDARTGPPR